jgi:ABC transport system ATP-binding/permease protein
MSAPAGLLPATVLHRGRRLALGPGGITIGRLEDNDIAIPSNAVSRHHARITPVEGGHWIVDLGSRNGTLLNGERFRGESRWLANGDTVVVGGEPLRFLTGDETRFEAARPAMLTTGRIRFSGDRLRVGRDDANDVVLDDPNVSRFHAEVVRTDAGV